MSSVIAPHSGRPENGSIKGERHEPPRVARHPLDTYADDGVKVMLEDGTLDPGQDPHLTADEVVAIYQAMVKTRLLDERLVLLQRQGRIGFHIGSLGEEATILGSAFATRPQDWLFPCY